VDRAQDEAVAVTRIDKYELLQTEAEVAFIARNFPGRKYKLGDTVQYAESRELRYWRQFQNDSEGPFVYAIFDAWKRLGHRLGVRPKSPESLRYLQDVINDAREALFQAVPLARLHEMADEETRA
jgi:hypothetical protein